MLPSYDTDLIDALGSERIPTLTYAVDWKNKRIVGNTDELEAMEQAVRLILETERYDWDIYSWNYGTELKRMLGKPLPVVQAILADKIADALLVDDRIMEIKDFDFERSGKDSLVVKFKVVTIFGDLKGQEVEVDV